MFVQYILIHVLQATSCCWGCGRGWPPPGTSSATWPYGCPPGIPSAWGWTPPQPTSASAWSGWGSSTSSTLRGAQLKGGGGGGVCPCNRRNEDEAARAFIVGLVVPFKRTVQCHTLVVHTLPPKRTKLIGTKLIRDKTRRDRCARTKSKGQNLSSTKC
jgi:hypothetical protein